MRAIISSGGGQYHLGSLSGDLPKDQGPPSSIEARVVRLEMDCGYVGFEDIYLIMSVTFGEDGEPIFLQDVHLSTGTKLISDTATMHDNARTKLQAQMDFALPALSKPVIDLT